MTAQRLQEDSAEGSTMVLDREPAWQSGKEPLKPKNNNRSAKSGDVEHLLGHIAADQIAEILALQPTLAELEQAVMRTAGADDIVGRSPRPLRGKVGRICEIIAPDEDELKH